MSREGDSPRAQAGTHTAESRHPAECEILEQVKAEKQAAAWTNLGNERPTLSLLIYWRKVVLGDRGRKIDSAIMDTGSRKSGYSSFPVWGLRI